MIHYVGGAAMKPMKAFWLIPWVIPLLVLIAPAAGLAAKRAKAIVTCQPAEARLEYECRILLTGRKSGQPITGAKILVKADMPSMAMAHNVRPVHAVPVSTPGMYKMRIKLEMFGEWTLRLKISGPMRDLVIAKYNFGTHHDAKGQDGKTLFVTKGCDHCHGNEGRGLANIKNTPFPRLAGQNPTYLVNQLKALKSGARKGAMSAIMQPPALTLSAAEMKKLADYLSKVK